MRGLVNPIFVPNAAELGDILSKVICPGDVVLTLGAGNIGAIAAELPGKLAAKLANGKTHG